MEIQDTYINAAHRMADAARPIAQHYFKQSMPVEIKADNSPVTLADKEIEMAIRAIIASEFPEHGILGEEMANKNIAADWVWVIDPIDGTRAFIAGKASFCTLIALCYKGDPVLGIIDQPIRKERWVGIQNQPTTLNGEAVKVSDCAELKDAMVSTTSTTYFTAAQATAFRRLEHATRSTLLNMDAYAFGMLASGDLDIVVESGLKPFDFCALVPVVLGAGGCITDWQKKSLNIHSTGEVMSSANKDLHKHTLDLIHNQN